MFMIESPPAARIAGTEFFIPTETPIWSTAIVLSYPSRVSPSQPARLAMPALLPSALKPP